MTTTELDPDTTALVLVDLNKGLLTVELEPHAPASVLENAVALAEGFRGCEAFVVLTTAAPAAPARRNALAAPQAERDLTKLSKVGTVPGWTEIAEELGPRDGDHLVRKPSWSAFFGTDLDLQLRRRGIQTLVLGGIATNFGVESTARDARAYGYAVVLAEDAASALTAEEHDGSCRHAFPMMGRVRTTAELLAGLGAPR